MKGASSDYILQIAVVGHTNTGKTSLLRTITRDPSFGEVDDAPGTTREVQSSVVLLEQQPVLRWYDTPGLEDSISLRDWIDHLPSKGQRLDGPERIEIFLADQAASRHFEQEHRVLTQVLRSDALLYVVDARDPVLAKHRDELYLLQACGKPVLPVMNFTAGPLADIEPWVTTFARNGMHIYLSFDTISPPINGEQMMYETLAQLLGNHRDLLGKIAQQVRTQRRERLEAAVIMLASLCVDVAASVRIVSNDPKKIETIAESFEADVKVQETVFVENLLTLYRFTSLDYLPEELGMSARQWSSDLFSKEAMTELGIQLGKGAAIGAAAGAAVDLLSAGLSLGTGMLIGAAAGSAWQGVERWGKDLSARMSGRRQLFASDEVLQVLAHRNLRLIAALESRGHASQQPISLEAEQGHGDLDAKSYLQIIRTVRQHALRWHVTDMLGESQQKSRATRELDHLFLGSSILGVFREDGLH